MISVVIPVYNVPTRRLAKTLRSIRAQSGVDLEIIVVDDGSSAVVPQSNQYQLIRQNNQGAPAARNAGLAAAQGTYVIFWDADVTARPTFLLTLQRALEKSPSAWYAYSWFQFGWKRFCFQEVTTEMLRQQNYIHTTSLFRRACAPLWDETLQRFQDWDYYLQCLENGGRGVLVQEVLFRVAAGGTMSQWLPSFCYQKPWSRLPWIRTVVDSYQTARQRIQEKHHLLDA